MEIVESGLGIVVVAPVAEGVDVGYVQRVGNGCSAICGDGEEFAPGVVGAAVSGQGGELSAVFPSQVGIELLTVSVSGGIATGIIYQIMGGIPIGYGS